MPIALTDEMKEAFENSITDSAFVMFASASKEGMPDIAFKGSAMVFDEEHVAFWERSLGTTFRNLQENPGVCLLYRNMAKRQIWKMFGQADVLTDGPVRQRIMDRTVQLELDRDPDRKGAGVLIRIDKVLALGQVVMER